MTTEELLEALVARTGRTPNSEQRVVMEQWGGPLQVIAGPGTGKTYALILRCLHLLCVDRVPPEAIVLTTFTRKAAEELRQRLHEALLRLGSVFPEVRTIDISPMRLGTLHSLCWDFLTETPGSPFRHLCPLVALDRAFFVYSRSRFCRFDQGSDIDALFIELASWVDNKSYKTLPAPWRRAQMFVTMYERLMNDRVDRARFAEARSAFKLLIQLVEEYEAALRDHHFTDQTLMQQQTLEILCAPEGRPLVQSLQYVIVDEYQDTNPLQAAIYRALAAMPPHNLCVVGDDDQAVHRFRGGTVSCLVRFAEECEQVWPGCQVQRVSLTETYRSHPEIVNWINEFITIHPHMLLPNARVREKAPLSAQPSRPATTPAVLAIRGKNAQEVARHFVEVLGALKEQGVIESYDQCALLAHSVKPGQEASPYISTLQEQDIPLTFLSPSKEQPVYRLILGTLLIALDRPGNYIPANFAANNASLARYVEECRAAAQADPVLSTMARQIHAWLLSDEAGARSMSLTTLALRILNARPCIEAIESEKAAELAAQTLIQTLDSFDRIVGHGYRIALDDSLGKKRVAKWWMERIYRILVEGVQNEQLERGEETVISFPTGAMPVLTIHRAKGLEFPVVAVVVEKENSGHPGASHRLEQDVLPFRQDLALIEDPSFILGGDAEARAVQDVVRLHYVAYSRAQAVLLLLVPDGYGKSPPALGLGTDAEWFHSRVEEWPARQQKTRKSKSAAGAAQEGVVQHGFEW